MSGKPLREGNLRVYATPFIPRQTLISTINDTSPEQTQKLDSVHDTCLTSHSISTQKLDSINDTSLTSPSISTQKLNLIDDQSLTSPVISTPELNSVFTSPPSKDSNSISKLNPFYEFNNGIDVPEFNPQTAVHSQSNSILNSEIYRLPDVIDADRPPNSLNIETPYDLLSGIGTISRPYIYIDVGGTQIHSLVDTGSSRTYIRSVGLNVLGSGGYKIDRSKAGAVMMANGSIEAVIGEACIRSLF